MYFDLLSKLGMLKPSSGGFLLVGKQTRFELASNGLKGLEAMNPG